MLSLVAIALDFGLHVEGSVVFVVSAVAILGLAWVVGLSTERLGALTGPQVGGILNATFGNIAELIIAFFALQAGLITVVKASLTGSIIGNLLLVLGAAVLAGGLKNGLQTFSQRIAGSNAALLVLAAVGLFIPAVFAASGTESQGTRVEESVLVALVLIVGYGLSLMWQFTNPEATLGGHGEPEGHAGPRWTGRVAVVVLLVAAALLAVLSEILVELDRAVHRAVRPVRAVRRRDPHPDHRQPRRAPRRGPARVQEQDRVRDGRHRSGRRSRSRCSWPPCSCCSGSCVGQPMDLVFQPLEIAAVGVAVAISALIALDGESNWLEGALLMLIYLIIAISFFELRLPIETL